MLRRVFVHFAALHFMHKNRSAACAAEQGVRPQRRSQLDSSLRLSKEHAFVLTDDDAISIWRKLESTFGSVVANVEFSDNIERSAESIDQLLGFENSLKRKIRRIEFSARSENRENQSMFIFNDYKHTPILLTATGADDVITPFSDYCEELIEGLKPWYSKLCNIDFFYIIGVIVYIAYMLLTIMIPDTPNDNPIELTKSIQILAVVSGGVGAIWLAIMGLNKVRARCFPLATFSIGQGKERYRVLENIRWGVVVAFGVSLAASTVFRILA
jgi:hypothetical protein